MSHKVLLIANGHGEESVMSWLKTKLEEHNLTVTTYAIVGQNPQHSYPGKLFDSGGFRPNLNTWIADIKNGFFSDLYQRFKTVSGLTQEADLTIAIGDALPALFPRLQGKPYLAINLAKSSRYQPAQKMGFDGLDYWLWQSKHCKGVWLRDRESLATVSQAIDSRYQSKIYYMGNPMFLTLGPIKQHSPNQLYKNLILLPGSRRPEADHNLVILQNIAAELTSYIPGLDTKVIAPWYENDSTPKIGFFEALDWADMALSLSGTATEQAIAKGLVVGVPGGMGPQMTTAFIDRQLTLLRPHLIDLRTANPAHRFFEVLGDYHQLPSSTIYQEEPEELFITSLINHLKNDVG
jgi:hypothetical protein